MNLKTFYSTMASLLMSASLLTPKLEARTCSGNADVIGSYGFTASRAGFFLLGATPPGTAGGPLIPVPIIPPGTGGGAVIGSNTPIGSLVAGLANRNAFASVGRIFADGMGILYASSTTGTLTTNTIVGTYIVSSDCSVTMTIGDPFGSKGSQTGSTGGIVGGTTTVFVGTNPISLEGLIVTSGVSDEIDLVPTGSNSLGASLTLIKTSQFNACSNASVNGSYSVIGQGLLTPGTSTTTIGGTTGGTGGTTGGLGGTTTGGTTTNATGTGAFVSGVTGSLGTPFLVFGRTVADGAGNLLTDVPSTTSPVKRSITGTYTVNADCTGTARLQDISLGVVRNVSFVLVSQGPANLLQTVARQTLEFVFIDPGVLGSGEAKQQ